VLRWLPRLFFSCPQRQNRTSIVWLTVRNKKYTTYILLHPRSGADEVTVSRLRRTTRECASIHPYQHIDDDHNKATLYNWAGVASHVHFPSAAAHVSAFECEVNKKYLLQTGTKWKVDDGATALGDDSDR
jgi:hypothetical protein